MSPEIAEMTVDLVRAVKTAKDEAVAYSELLGLALERAGQLERLTKRQAETIRWHCETNQALQAENAALRSELRRGGASMWRRGAVA